MSAANAVNKFNLLTPDQLAVLPDLEWLVAGILPKPCFAIMYGPPGCGKTFIALSMALEIANARDWLGRCVRKADVLYIAAEGVLGLKLRTAAYRERNGAIGDNLRFLAEAPNLLKTEDLEELGGTLQAAGFKPGLIVVDTLARVTTGADENNARDMGAAVEALDALKSHYDAAVLVLHHTTKNGGSERGSSALRGAADVMIQCSKEEAADGPAVALECTKMKDDEPFKNIAAVLKRVELPNGRSSLVVSHETDLQSIGGTIAQQQILDILATEFTENGATNKELLAAFIDAKYGSQSTFNRGLKALKEKKELRLEGKRKGARYFLGGAT